MHSTSALIYTCDLVGQHAPLSRIPNMEFKSERIKTTTQTYSVEIAQASHKSHPHGLTNFPSMNLKTPLLAFCKLTKALADELSLPCQQPCSFSTGETSLPSSFESTRQIYQPRLNLLLFNRNSLRLHGDYLMLRTPRLLSVHLGYSFSYTAAKPFSSSTAKMVRIPSLFSIEVGVQTWGSAAGEDQGTEE